ncbi:hypothetical protein HHI36_016587 [Cryptolaemus montrouzieri]|uniref:Peptidase S1 domain-containing protein n=1 Tax=Cryptolaemus montrouzieri TaxID=559131 RepID=A0ABD2NK94_9CUCU
MKYYKFITLISLSVSIYASDYDDDDSSSGEIPAKFEGLEVLDSEPAELNLGIINGNEAEPHSYPFQALIKMKVSKDRTAFCGGTLLTQRFVLSAGHCGQGYLGATITLGAHNISANENTTIEVNVRRIKLHEKFSRKTFSNDIALFELDDPVTYGLYIQPVQLPPRSYIRKNLKNKNATTIGWGLTNGTTAKQSPVLQEVQEKITSNFDCWLKFPQHVKKTNICISGKNDKSACNGDSGGPLIVDGYQVGITSFGARNCKSGYPTVFTRITKYLKWVEKNSDYRTN